MADLQVEAQDLIKLAAVVNTAEAEENEYYEMSNAFHELLQTTADKTVIGECPDFIGHIAEILRFCKDYGINTYEVTQEALIAAEGRK